MSDTAASAAAAASGDDPSAGPGPDGREMAMVHAVFRRNLADGPAQIRAVAPGDTQRVRQLADHLVLVLDALHHHHAGEDELVWPLLLERAPGDARLISAMQGQHEAVSALVAQARALAAQWGASGSSTLGEQLAQTVEELCPALFAHLDDEERQAVPVIVRHLSIPEWDRLRQHAMAQMAPPQLPLFLGMMLEALPEPSQSEFLAHLPPTEAQRWTNGGRAYFDGYIRGIRGT